MDLRPGSGGSAGEVSLELGRMTMAGREDAAEQVRQLYEEHYDAVFRYLYLSSSAPIDADEFIQEAFLRMFQALREGSHIDKPRNWLLRVAHNLRHDEQRFGRHSSDSLKTRQSSISTASKRPCSSFMVSVIKPSCHFYQTRYSLASGDLGKKSYTLSTKARITHRWTGGMRISWTSVNV